MRVSGGRGTLRCALTILGCGVSQFAQFRLFRQCTIAGWFLCVFLPGHKAQIFLGFISILI